MAATFLPFVKCSHCSVGIPISMIGDHTCSRATPLPSTRLKAIDGPFAPTSQKQIMGHPLSKPTKTPDLSKPHRTPPPPVPRIDVAAIYKAESSLHNKALPSPIIASSSRSAFPTSVGKKPKSYKMPPRSATSPLPSRPVSPASPLPQDCPFPPFPAARSWSATPTTPLETSFAIPSEKGGERGSVDKNNRYSGGNGVMQRMDSIVPGPFNQSQKSEIKTSGHMKSGSMSSSHDFVRSTRSSKVKAHVQRPSTSSSNYTSHPSFSSISTGPRSTLNRSKTDIPAILLCGRPSFPESFGNGTNEPLPVEPSFNIPAEPNFGYGSVGQKTRSQTCPENDSGGAMADKLTASQKIQSESSVHSHKPNPSIAAAAMQPLHDIGSTSSFKPSRAIRDPTASPAFDFGNAGRSTKPNMNEIRGDKRLIDAPPVPITVRAESYRHENPNHTLHESTSSSESYSSSAKSGSSRSSTPLNDSPLRPSENSVDNHRANDMFAGFVFDVEKPETLTEPAVTRNDRMRNSSKTRPMDIPVPLRPTIPTSAQLEGEPNHYSSPAMSTGEHVVSSIATQSNNLRVSPTPLAPTALTDPAARKPTAAHKGNCRGCGELIQGKSVSSADGRLTGRYHKRCFVCKACQAPFPTADFYVMNNHPYCARHYHELNHSLCTRCDRGIEGQYLETELMQKFHPHCFGCQECHRILRDDYFEWNGRILCEQHAFGVEQQPSSLGPGRRYAERRTTRLMMM